MNRLITLLEAFFVAIIGGVTAGAWIVWQIMRRRDE